MEPDRLILMRIEHLEKTFGERFSDQEESLSVLHGKVDVLNVDVREHLAVSEHAGKRVAKMDEVIWGGGGGDDGLVGEVRDLKNEAIRRAKLQTYFTLPMAVGFFLIVLGMTINRISTGSWVP